MVRRYTPRPHPPGRRQVQTPRHRIAPRVRRRLHDGRLPSLRKKSAIGPTPQTRLPFSFEFPFILPSRSNRKMRREEYNSGQSARPPASLSSSATTCRTAFDSLDTLSDLVEPEIGGSLWPLMAQSGRTPMRSRQLSATSESETARNHLYDAERYRSISAG